MNFTCGMKFICFVLKLNVLIKMIWRILLSVNGTVAARLEWLNNYINKKHMKFCQVFFSDVI